MWSASARTTDFQGWRAAGRTNELDDEEAEADSQGTFAAIQSLTVGAPLTWSALAAAPRTTKPPPRFNEATLVKELEERGIGRPSTFASLIATIQEKEYVEKKTIEGRKVQVPRLSLKVGNAIQRQLVERSVGGERDRLVPTHLGTQMLAFALEHFGDLFAYEFTAAMENRLDAVADRGEPWKQVLRDTWATYKDRYQALSDGGGRATAARERVFADGLKAVMTRKGPMLLREGAAKTVFYPWPGGEFETLTEEAAVAATQFEVLGTTAAGAQIVKKNGKFGAYATDGTVNVPLAADDNEESLRAKFAAKAAVAETRVGPFTFRVGQYGPYMYKTDLKTKKFVPVPASIDAKALTIREADEIYKRGLEAKAATTSKFTPKSRT